MNSKLRLWGVFLTGIFCAKSGSVALEVEGRVQQQNNSSVERSQGEYSHFSKRLAYVQILAGLFSKPECEYIKAMNFSFRCHDRDVFSPYLSVFKDDIFKKPVFNLAPFKRIETYAYCRVVSKQKSNFWRTFNRILWDTDACDVLLESNSLDFNKPGKYSDQHLTAFNSFDVNGSMLLKALMCIENEIDCAPVVESYKKRADLDPEKVKSLAALENCIVDVNSACDKLISLLVKSSKFAELAFVSRFIFRRIQYERSNNDVIILDIQRADLVSLMAVMALVKDSVVFGQIKSFCTDYDSDCGPSSMSDEKWKKILGQ